MWQQTTAGISDASLTGFVSDCQYMIRETLVAFEVLHCFKGISSWSLDGSIWWIGSFLSPEAAIILSSTKNCKLLVRLTVEVCDPSTSMNSGIFDWQRKQNDYSSDSWWGPNKLLSLGDKYEKVYVEQSRFFPHPIVVLWHRGLKLVFSSAILPNWHKAGIENWPIHTNKFLPVLFTLLWNTYLSAAKSNRLSVHRSG